MHLICNERVAGSTPVPGSIYFVRKMIESVEFLKVFVSDVGMCVFGELP